MVILVIVIVPGMYDAADQALDCYEYLIII